MWRWSLIAVLLLSATAGHVPAFNEAGSSPETAFVVDDPDKSWVFYDRLGDDEQHWFRFDMANGNELFTSINLPATEAARPTLWIVGPGFSAPGPSGTPDGLGGELVPTRDELTIEPFTPLAMRNVAEWRGQVPTGGTHYLVIESTAAVQYSVAIGARESFTPLEWVGIPVERIAIQHWAGIPWPVAMAGEVLAISTVLVIARRRKWTGQRTLGMAGAAAVAGTAFTTLLLALIAAVQAGVSAGLVIPFVFALAALGVGLGAYRGVRNGPWWAGLAWGVGGLVVWAGLLVGPALLLAWSIWTRRSKAASGS
jgi:hypothetical protein